MPVGRGWPRSSFRRLHQSSLDRSAESSCGLDDGPSTGVGWRPSRSRWQLHDRGIALHGKGEAMTNVVISSAARTAIGSFGRSLRDVPPTILGATAARAAIERADIEPGQVEHVVFGNVIHTSPEDMYLARVV